MSDVIEVAGLVKTYPGGVRALDGIDFGVEVGSVFGLLGPNGAASRTAVKVLTTLTRPDAGEARVAGLDVVRRAGGRAPHPSVWSRSSRAATARRPAREPAVCRGHLYGMKGRALEERVSALLERLNLADAADRVASTYSGGMQRRLDVAIGWSIVRRSCSWMSRRPAWTRRDARVCGRRSSASWPMKA